MFHSQNHPQEPVEVFALLQESQGYRNLWMTDEALKVLKRVPAEHRVMARVVLERALIFMCKARFGYAYKIAKLASSAYPKDLSFVAIQVATSVIAKRQRLATRLLATLSPEDRIAIQYNTTCIRCQLGSPVQIIREDLKKIFKERPALEAFSKIDTDLTDAPAPPSAFFVRKTIKLAHRST